MQGKIYFLHMMTDSAHNTARRLVEATTVSEVLYIILSNVSTRLGNFGGFRLDYKHRTDDLGSFMGRMDFESDIPLAFRPVLKDAGKNTR